MSGFQSFFRVFASFCIDQISHQQHNGKVERNDLGLGRAFVWDT